MASDNEPEKEFVDPIWSTWKYGHDLAFGAAAMMAEHMATGIEAELPEERGDPVRVLRSFAHILRSGKYDPKERPHAMIPVDEAIAHALDDPRVLGALADKIAAATLITRASSSAPDQAAWILGCLKEILLPPAEADDDD